MPAAAIAKRSVITRDDDGDAVMQSSSKPKWLSKDFRVVATRLECMTERVVVVTRNGGWWGTRLAVT